MADAASALRKLTSGQTLTNEERKLLGMAPVAEKAPAPTTYNQRVVAAIKGGYQNELDVNANRVTPKPTPKPDDKPTWVKAGTVQTVNGPVDVDANGKAQDGSVPIAVSKTPEEDMLFEFTDPDTGVITKFRTAGELSAFAVKWATGKAANTKADLAAQQKAIDDKNRKTAQQEFRAALSELGLGDLADAVDKMITEDKTVSQIKLELPGTQAYKDRFPGMAALKAAGQAISEATYIANERAMIQSANAYGIDKALVTRSLLGQYIGNQVAPTEFERRAEMAANRVDKRTDVVEAMTTYFPGVDKGGLITYLLNPTIGMDVIKKQVRAAEIGAAAVAGGYTKTGLGTVNLSKAESLIDATGTKDLAQLKAEFGQAGILGRTQARLAGIEGQQYDTFESAQAVIGSDAAAIMASKKRAEREAMFRFGGQSGVSASSLRSTEVF
jgi:hypothetical protein